MKAAMSAEIAPPVVCLQGTITYEELVQVCNAMAANTKQCPDAFQHPAAMAYCVVSHGPAVRATHAAEFSPFGLSLVTVNSSPWTGQSRPRVCSCCARP
jgi:hypothetical protein